MIIFVKEIIISLNFRIKNLYKSVVIFLKNITINVFEYKGNINDSFVERKYNLWRTATCGLCITKVRYSFRIKNITVETVRREKQQL